MYCRPLPILPWSFRRPSGETELKLPLLQALALTLGRRQEIEVRGSGGLPQFH